MKKLIILSIVLAIFSACNQTTSSQVKKQNIKLELTQDELASIGNNSNAGASILVRKAIEKEMANYKYTPEEEKELEKAIENVKMEFFLNRTASKNTHVADVEVLQVYKDNADKLKDADIIQVLPEIKNQIFLQRVGEEKIKYMNSLVEKYDLNTILKKYFPDTKKEIKEEVKQEEVKKDTTTKKK